MTQGNTTLSHEGDGRVNGLWRAWFWAKWEGLLCKCVCVFVRDLDGSLCSLSWVPDLIMTSLGSASMHSSYSWFFKTFVWCLFLYFESFFSPWMFLLFTSLLPCLSFLIYLNVNLFFFFSPRSSHCVYRRSSPCSSSHFSPFFPLILHHLFVFFPLFGPIDTWEVTSSRLCTQ